MIYVLLLLMEYKSFNQKLEAMCNDADKFGKLKDTIFHISESINTYLKIKTAASILTGVASYAVLMTMQVDYAGFWALLIFLLNFIPTIGSIVAVTFTLLAVSIQFTSMTPLLVLAGLLGTIQFIVGNIIEPKFMGTHLNLSPIIIILSLAFWGKFGACSECYSAYQP